MRDAGILEPVFIEIALFARTYRPPRQKDEDKNPLSECQVDGAARREVTSL